jgi:predicted nucleic acid-binding protein
MFELPLRIFPVYPETVYKALDFMEKYKLKPRDAIHTASMVENGVKTIVTEDPDFVRIKEIKVLKLAEFLERLKT